MFETEAKEYLDTESKYLIEDNEGNIINIAKKVKQAFIDGAEFGYNKANEWHFVKDGDLPKHEVNVLVLFNKQCIDIAHYNYDYKEWHFTDSIVRDVIAWCEIPRYAEGGANYDK